MGPRVGPRVRVCCLDSPPARPRAWRPWSFCWGWGYSYPHMVLVTSRACLQRYLESYSPRGSSWMVHNILDKGVLARRVNRREVAFCTDVARNDGTRNFLLTWKKFLKVSLKPAPL